MPKQKRLPDAAQQQLLEEVRVKLAPRSWLSKINQRLNQHLYAHSNEFGQRFQSISDRCSDPCRTVFRSGATLCVDSYEGAQIESRIALRFGRRFGARRATLLLAAG
jgi:hypothetical protein